MTRYLSIVGLAGHIDHGKTTLIKMLTGIKLDRRKEEQERKITIDLGFAYINYNENELVGIVDTPGHRKFLHNMLVAASSLDIAILVVDANEGVKEQTKEHLTILELLNVESLIVVITKVDIASKSTVDSTRNQIRELLISSQFSDSEILQSSLKNDYGASEIKELIYKLATAKKSNRYKQYFRMPIDNIYSIKGHGIIITGYTDQGECSVNDTFVIGGLDKEVRIRNIKSHDIELTRSFKRARTALNIRGVGRSLIKRGMIVVDSKVNRAYYQGIAKLSHLPDNLKSARKYLISIHTAQSICKFYFTKPIDNVSQAIVKINFDTKIQIVHGDRFIVRSSSGDTILAGGKILLPLAKKLSMKEFEDNKDAYARIDSKNPIVEYLELSRGGLLVSEVVALFNIMESEIVTVIKDFGSIKLVELSNEKLLINEADRNLIYKQIVTHLANSKDQELEESRVIRLLSFESKILSHYWLESALQDGVIVKRGAKYLLPESKRILTAAELKLQEQITNLFKSSGYDTPKIKSLPNLLSSPKQLLSNVIKHLISSGQLITISPEYSLLKDQLESAKMLLEEEIKRNGNITTGRFRDILVGLGRKKTIELLEYFDQAKVTKRIDNAGSRILL
ncbi:MAG: selenocysteine-specific translation elongation factor [Nitrospinota bacterium]